MSTKLSNFFVALGCLSMLVGGAFFIYFLINKSIGTAFLYASISFILMIILAVIGSQIDEKRKRKHKEYLLTLQPTEKQFQETQTFVSFDLLSKIAMDEQNERIYLWAPEKRSVQSLKDISYRMPYQLFSYAYAEILAVEVVESGASIRMNSRRSQSSKFFLDGLQPITEDFLKEQTDEQPAYSIMLKLILKDRVKPIHLIQFYADSAKSPNKNSEIYQKVLKDLEHWFTVLHFIMKDIDKIEGYEYDPNDETNNLIEKSHAINSSGFKSKRVKQMKQTTNFNTSKDITFARVQLLSVLNQVTYMKLNEGLLLNNDEETKKYPEVSSSYFNQLLEKNREQMRNDINKE